MINHFPEVYLMENEKIHKTITRQIIILIYIHKAMHNQGPIWQEK